MLGFCGVGASGSTIDRTNVPVEMLLEDLLDAGNRKNCGSIAVCSIVSNAPGVTLTDCIVAASVKVMFTSAVGWKLVITSGTT